MQEMLRLFTFSRGKAVDQLCGGYQSEVVRRSLQEQIALQLPVICVYYLYLCPRSCWA